MINKARNVQAPVIPWAAGVCINKGDCGSSVVDTILELSVVLAMVVVAVVRGLPAVEIILVVSLLVTDVVESLMLAIVKMM